MITAAAPQILCLLLGHEELDLSGFGLEVQNESQVTGSWQSNNSPKLSFTTNCNEKILYCCVMVMLETCKENRDNDRMQLMLGLGLKLILINVTHAP